MADIQIGQSKSTGQWFVKLPGNEIREITPEQAAQVESNPGTISNILGAAGGATQQLYQGGKQLMGGLLGDTGMEGEAAAERERLGQQQEARGFGSGVSTAIGQAVPYVAADVAALAAGGLPAAIGVGAGLGAATTPESPVEGGLIGGAGAALPALIPPAVRGAQNLARGVGNFEFPVPGITGSAPRNMSERVVQNIDPEFVGPPRPVQRFHEGLMTEQEVLETGAQLSPAQRMLLNARDSADIQKAKQVKWVEGIRGVDPSIDASQRMAMTSLVREGLGISGDKALNNATVGRALQDIGKGMDNVMSQVQGPGIKLETDTLARMNEVVDASKSDWQGQLGKVVKGLEDAAKKNGGFIDQDTFQWARRKLGTEPTGLANPKADALQVLHANTVMSELAEQLEKQLQSKALKEELRRLRYGYKIGMTLDQGRTVGSDGLVNPTTFSNNWDRSTHAKWKGIDKLSKAAETFDTLARQEAHAGSTLQREFAKFPNRVKENVITGAATFGAGAAAGGYGLFGGN